jgi:hypothetical protein
MAGPMTRLARGLLPIAAVMSIAGALLTHSLGAVAYTTGSTGYDISYPQCGGRLPSGDFGVVGVNGGYPFVHYNPCLRAEYAYTPNAALYVNTGYHPSYTRVDGKHTTVECLAKSRGIEGSPSQRAAWAVGCSEASRSIGYASSQGATNPGSWWLDVETENSWSSTDLTLNQFTIQGIVDTLLRESPAAVGIYSTGYQWRTIMGSLPVSGVVANWVATGARSDRRVQRYCGTGFSGAPVWFVQYLRGGFDTNYVC